MQTVSVPIDDQLASGLGKLASRSGSTVEQIMRDAAATFAEEVELENFLAEGERDVSNGRIVSHEEVLRFLNGMEERAREEVERRSRLA